MVPIPSTCPIKHSHAKSMVVTLLVCLFFYLAQQPPVGQDPLIHEVSRSHSTAQRIRQDSSGRVISSLQRPLPDNTQHSQQTDIHASGGIRTDNPNKRAAADPRLRPRGHCDRRLDVYYKYEIIELVKNASFSIFWREKVFYECCFEQFITC